MALISFGLAGGLDPEQDSGTLVLADRVLCPTGKALKTDRSWREKAYALARGAGLYPYIGSLIGSEIPIADVAAKHRAFTLSGAVAADMESHILASVAREAGIPFLVMRIIGDPANCPLPKAALTGIDRSGRIRPDLVLASLLRHPSEISDLMILARHSARARTVLRRTACLRADLVCPNDIGHE